MKLMIVKVVAWSTVTAAVGSTLVLAAVGPTLSTATACVVEPAEPAAWLTVDVRDVHDACAGAAPPGAGSANDRAAALLTSARVAPATRPLTRRSVET